MAEAYAHRAFALIGRLLLLAVQLHHLQRRLSDRIGTKRIASSLNASLPADRIRERHGMYPASS